MRLHKEERISRRRDETGRISLKDGVLTAPYQYSEAELKAAVAEQARLGGWGGGALHGGTGAGSQWRRGWRRSTTHFSCRSGRWQR